MLSNEANEHEREAVFKRETGTKRGATGSWTKDRDAPSERVRAFDRIRSFKSLPAAAFPRHAHRATARPDRRAALPDAPASRAPISGADRPAPPIGDSSKKPVARPLGPSPTGSFMLTCGLEKTTDRPALPAAHRLFPLPIPPGDRRSSIQGDPTARIYPEMPPNRPETASEPFAEAAVSGLSLRDVSRLENLSAAFQQIGALIRQGDMGSGNDAPRGRLLGTSGGGGSPAIKVRFSRFRGTVQQDPVQRQETQIVQPQFDLRDLLP